MVLQQDQVLKDTQAHQYPKLGGKAEPSTARRGNILIYLLLLHFF